MDPENSNKFEENISKSLVEHGPAVKAVTKIMALGIDQGASDILIEPGPEGIRVRYRIDGILYERLSLPVSFQEGIISRVKVMSGLDIAEHRLPQEGRFRMRFQGRDIDFRVSAVPTTLGEKIVLRILDKIKVILDINKLGFDERTLGLFKRNLTKPFGMILVCGPTGSGKTTTLYSALNFINSIETNIVTVEDPIEYELSGINQVAVQDSIGLTFAAALRSILRQDPDIVLVGEIRDSETADIAVKAALTGHLILTTLHTTSAPSAMVRLADMGVEPFLISSSCLLISSQVLLRTVCTDCRQPYPLSQKILDELKAENPSLNFDRASCLYKPKGCPKCNNTGYKGRAALSETMEVTPGIKELIVNGAPEAEIRRFAQKEGMVLLRENAAALALKGLTTMEEVVRVTSG
ncbi:MAG: type II secretion system protein GspE [Candidatus Omnitrophica bacterium CG11_big_fil_rev_8_21_14_0_20_42_13]|uniref:Type II secretion system protein GspE n=1 Tax=Candidatus Ghiorseimicrobium undicola TaxID=1974746 RepID=A0A2H0LYF1_9BACT|nr:MAG: type II secretion system protein GspE [Candidatus Omnitrophica bacterium CG11_big_fil_rev_8_21_14_0_20_42_13]